MKFHLALEDGRWIGGMTCRRDNLDEQLDDLRDRATEWKMSIIATRLGKVGKGQQYVITPR